MSKANALKAIKEVRPDAKGRVLLGKLAQGHNSYRVYCDDEGRIILEPYVLVPANEKWLFENEAALASVKRGLAESAQGKAKPLGPFAKHLDEDEE
jgi:hypothetical protein